MMNIGIRRRWAINKLLVDYILHLGFEGLAALGGYYARGFCKHTRHRVGVAIVWSMASTALLVSFVG
jgi:hypothetical protein